MRRMISMMSMPALFLIGMTALAPAKAKQDAGKDAMKEAARSIAALEERVKELEQKVAEQESDLVRFARFADGVSIGVARLAAAGDASRDHGFEAAGPNPAARTDLLDGIRSFSDSVKKSLEKTDEEKEKEAKEKEEREAEEKANGAKGAENGTEKGAEKTPENGKNPKERSNGGN